MVHVLGGARTDVAVNRSRVSDEPLRAMLADAVSRALADADAAATEVGFVVGAA